MYDAYPGIMLREFAREGWEEPPFYERLFECDFLLMKTDPLPGLREHGQEAMEIIESGPSFFEESFEVVWQHTLPDGDTIYLYEKQYHLEGEYAETDFRAAAAEIEGLAQDGDGIILVPGAQVEVLGRYYTGDLPVYPLPADAPLDEGAVEQELAGIVGAHQRVFLVVWTGGDTETAAFVSGWLNEHSLGVSDSEHGEVHVLLYDGPKRG
jgi:hypothetical protein